MRSLLALVLVALPTSLPAAEFITVDYPGASSTLAWGINDIGQVTGYYNLGTAQNAFVRHSDGTFVSIGVAGAIGTQGVAINNLGVVVGTTTSPQNNVSGFIWHPNGELETISFPGSPSLQPTGINTAGEMVGLYVPGSAELGFLRDTHGNITPLLPPGGIASYAWEINDSSQVAGHFHASSAEQSFIREADGSYTVFSVQQASGGTYARSINNHGVVAGYWIDSHQISHGFVRDVAGNITTFDAIDPQTHPTVSTLALSINDAGFLVGQTSRTGVLASYERDPAGNIGMFVDPAATQTETAVLRINNFNVVAGYYADLVNINHGFIAIRQP